MINWTFDFGFFIFNLSPVVVSDQGSMLWKNYVL